MTIKARECLKIIQNLFAEPKYTALTIRTKAYVKLMCYCHLAGEQEITGLGRIKNGEIIDFKIPYQEVTGTTADASDEGIINLMREIPIDEIKEWELDWHSHVDMEAFISQTDEANYELMAMARGNNQFPLMVTNKRGDFCIKNFIHAGKCPDIKLSLIKEPITNAQIEKIYAQCKAEVEERLSMKAIKYKPKNYNSYNSYKNYSYNNKNKLFGSGTTDSDAYGVCRSCGEPLVTAVEFENGLCEDCIEAIYARKSW